MKILLLANYVQPISIRNGWQKKSALPTWAQWLDVGELKIRPPSTPTYTLASEISSFETRYLQWPLLWFCSPSSGFQLRAVRQLHVAFAQFISYNGFTIPSIMLMLAFVLIFLPQLINAQCWNLELPWGTYSAAYDSTTNVSCSTSIHELELIPHVS